MTGYDIFKDVIIPLLAAILGGSITLAGVYLTIRKSDQNRKEDEIKKARPIFSFHMLSQEPKINLVMPHLCLADTNEGNNFACVVFFEIENSSLSSFEIKRIYRDGKWVGVEGNTIVLPSTTCLLNFPFSDNPLRIFLEIEDILFNKHYYQLFVLALKQRASDGKYLHTIRGIKSIAIEDMEELIKEDNLLEIKN